MFVSMGGSGRPTPVFFLLWVSGGSTLPRTHHHPPFQWPTPQEALSRAESRARSAVESVPALYRAQLEERALPEKEGGDLPSAAECSELLGRWRKDLEQRLDTPASQKDGAAEAGTSSGGGLPGQRRPAVVHRHCAKREFCPQGRFAPLPYPRRARHSERERSDRFKKAEARRCLPPGTPTAGALRLLN